MLGDYSVRGARLRREFSSADILGLNRPRIPPGLGPFPGSTPLRVWRGHSRRAACERHCGRLRPRSAAGRVFALWRRSRLAGTLAPVGTRSQSVSRLQGHAVCFTPSGDGLTKVFGSRLFSSGGCRFETTFECAPSGSTAAAPMGHPPPPPSPDSDDPATSFCRCRSVAQLGFLCRVVADLSDVLPTHRMPWCSISETHTTSVSRFCCGAWHTAATCRRERTHVRRKTRPIARTSTTQPHMRVVVG